MIIDLQAFCTTDETRTSLRWPFSDDKWTYASDGRIGIRVPTTGQQPPTELIGGCNPPIKGLRDLFDKLPKLTEPSYEIPPLPEVETEPCKYCKGAGKFNKCRTCNGTGHEQCDLGHAHECANCGGEGERPSKDGNEQCADCDGTGQQEKQQAVRVGVAAFDAKYLRMINTLPGARLCVHGGKEAAKIIFTGGDGILMPMQIK